MYEIDEALRQIEILESRLFIIKSPEKMSDTGINNTYFMDKDIIYIINRNCTYTSTDIKKLLKASGYMIQYEDSLKAALLLKLIEIVKANSLNEAVFRGIRFDKGGLAYKIIDYSPDDKTGILLREIDNRILLIIDFPKYGKVLWTTRGEYSNDQVGLKQCVSSYSSHRKNFVSYFVQE